MDGLLGVFRVHRCQCDLDVSRMGEYTSHSALHLLFGITGFVFMKQTKTEWE